MCIRDRIWAARSIANVFDVLRLEYPRTEKTEAPSFTKNFLQEHKHPVVNMIAQAREITKHTQHLLILFYVTNTKAEYMQK